MTECSGCLFAIGWVLGIGVGWYLHYIHMKVSERKKEGFNGNI
jgi:hypothetical protein